MSEPGPNGIDEAFLQRIEPLARSVHRYCRVKVSGTENVPKGKALLVANHTGWLGLDGLNLYVTVRDHLERDLFTAVHPNFFTTPLIRDIAPRIGFFEAGVRETVKVLDRGELVLFFPEGEQGNFKPIWELYQLQPFKPGFARVALAADAPVVPVVIIGGEEANPSLARLDFLKDSLGLGLPVPTNVFPLPVKWRITFLPPIKMDKYLAPDMADADTIELLRRDVEAVMREAVVRELKARGDPFF